ncbi:MAG: hypothetical protein H6Q23_1103, partial [Bacteroidetes bacterium]|nr:hypothetical protein [Bacteroidota bacterium]
MIKAEWERLILTATRQSSTNYQPNLGLVLRNSELTEKYIRDFRPDTGKFFVLIRYTVQNSKDITYGLVDFLIIELLTGRKFLCEPGQTGLQYSDMENTELLILSEASESERSEYNTLKIRWTEKSSELDDFLLILEQRKRFNINTEDKYFSIFGKEETEKAGLRYRMEKLRIVLSIMKDTPGLSYRELLTMAEERLKSAEIKNNEIRLRIARSQNCVNTESFDFPGTYITEDLKNKYTKSVKALLRKIWFLCHPDTSPDYNNLSEEKKKEIDELWLRTMSSTKEEQYSYSPNMLLYHLPDKDQLEAIYLRICTILGIEADYYETGNRLDFMIRTGTSITGLIEFLKYEISKISLQLTNLELIQDEYTNDIKTQKYRSALENISRHSDMLKNEIGELKVSLRLLKDEIIKEFKNAN